MWGIGEYSPHGALGGSVAAHTGELASLGKPRSGECSGFLEGYLHPGLWAAFNHPLPEGGCRHP